MIETIVRSYLISRNITGVGRNVKFHVPDDPPSEYILIQKTGSGRTNRIDRAMVAVQSISRTNYETAATINEAVREAMFEMADNCPEIYRCELNSDGDFTDTETKEYRYQAVYNIYY